MCACPHVARLTLTLNWIHPKDRQRLKLPKYSSTRITTLVFVHYYASTYSFSISTHAVFLHSSFTIQLYFTHFSVPYFSLSLSLSLSLLSILFSDRNHITKFTNITHSQKNEPCYPRIVAYKRRKIVAQHCYWLNSKSNIITMIRNAFVLFLITSQEEKQKSKLETTDTSTTWED